MNEYGHGNQEDPVRLLTDDEIAEMTQDERDELMAECDWEPADPDVCDACAAYLFTPVKETSVEVVDVVMVRIKGVTTQLLSEFLRWQMDTGAMAYLGTSSNGLGTYQACHRASDVGEIKRWFEDRGIVVTS